MDRHLRIAALPLALGLVLAIVAGCGSSGYDKAGGGKSKPTVLTMLTANGITAELQPFASEVSRLSGGAMRIEFRDGGRSGQVGYETGLINDVRQGKADLSWVGSRAWDSVGVRSFDALDAPLLIDSYALEARVLESSIPREMLKGLEPLGLVGIGVLPGPLQKLLGVRPLVRLADFSGLKIGIQVSRVAEETLRALGATAVALPTGTWIKSLDGIAQHLGSIYGNGYDERAKYLTANVTLWPRPPVIFMARRAFAELRAPQQQILRKAAIEEIPAYLSALRNQDQQALIGLCGRAVDLVTASPADLAALRSALAPVNATLERDPQTRSFIQSITAMRTRLPVPAPATCSAAASRHSTSSTILVGTYTGFATSRDWRGVPPDQSQSQYRIVRRTLILGPGTVVLNETLPNGQSDVGWNGTYSVYRDRIVFTNASDGFKVTAHWSFNGKNLTLSDVVGPGPGDAVVWGSHPWTKTR